MLLRISLVRTRGLLSTVRSRSVDPGRAGEFDLYILMIEGSLARATLEPWPSLLPQTASQLFLSQ
jgi:hypothetical protein